MGQWFVRYARTVSRTVNIGNDPMRDWIRGLIGFVVLAAALQAGAAPGLFLGTQATPLEQHAATELQRYMYILTKRVFPIRAVDSVPAEAEGIVLGTPSSLPTLPESWPFGLEPPMHDGYVLHALRKDNRLVVVAGQVPGGVQNGVYALLEEAGLGFYLGGDTYPEHPLEVERLDPARLNVSRSPVFAIRGTLPWCNFLNSIAGWEPEDYRAYIDRLVRMRLNFVGFHAYDSEPFAAYEWNGALVGGEPLPNTSKPVWGTVPLATTNFFAGTGRYFDGDHFGASSSFIEDRAESIRAAKGVLRDALAYAKGRGMKVCLGFEVQGDAFDPDVQAQFEARLSALLRDYPMLDYVWVWEPEGRAVQVADEPRHRSLWQSYRNRWRHVFADIDNEGRRAEATRMTMFGLQAHQLLKALRPDVGLILSGWGGDQWLQCTDFFPGMDKLLPPDVVFSALDNIRVTPSVSNAYGKLEVQRPRWPILWFEFDGDQWMPQPNLFETAAACRDARDKGCQGLLGIHWRTRAVEDTAAYVARFAWEPTLTVEQFCERRARDLFGEQLGQALGSNLVRLQRLGYRWLGGEGQSECAAFIWSTGEDRKVAELAEIAWDLHSRIEQHGLLEDLIPSWLSGLVAKPLPSLIPAVTAPARAVVRTGFAPTVRADKCAALRDLAHHVAYVLAYDHAAAELGSSRLDDLVAAGRADDALRLVRTSRLAEAMRLYAGQIRSKDELGVLATMNAKAWADVRKRLALPEETLKPLEALPDDFSDPPGVLVLPDRVIVVGLPGKDLQIAMKTRPIGSKRYEKYPLSRMGRTTFSLAFPQKMSGNVEYGLEVRSGRRLRLVWPEGFPASTRTMTLATLQEIPAPRPPDPSGVNPPTVRHQILADIHSVVLTWDRRPQESYTVYRDGKRLGVVWDGWFEDSEPPSNTDVTYAVEARNLLTDHAATTQLPVSIPQLPLPVAPKNIRAATRANRVILGWDSDAPQAAQYYIVKYDSRNSVIEETYIDADYGHYLQISDQVLPGTVYSYSIAGVTPDGRVGPPSRRVGVVSSTEPLRPVLQLSFNDASFLEGMARVAENALALGGSGWAELPPQPEWDPKHALSLTAWVKLDSIEGAPVLICKGAWQQAGYFLQVLHKQVRFYMAGVDTLDAGHPRAAVWQHIAATYGFGEMRMYLNGELAGRKRVSGRPRPSESPLLLGRYGLSDDWYFVRGLMDDVRIYDVPLTPEEVRALYQETRRD